MDLVIQKILEQQLKLMELFAERLGAPQQTPSQTKLIMSGEALENFISEFVYVTDVNSIFSTWFTCFEEIFNVDFWKQTDDSKIRLLLQKMGPSGHDKYSNYILPRYPTQSNRKYVSGKLNSHPVHLQIDTASGTETMENHRPASINIYKICSTEHFRGLCPYYRWIASSN